jgi:dTDP-4-amino-4,6-dideoxygalactose transaminase
MTMSQIPLVDLAAQHRQIAEKVAQGFARVLENTCFIDGPDVRAFEDAFALFVETRHCVAVANGTDALELAVRAAEIGPGDEVLLPANTFIATALAVSRAGATPVLVDCDPTYYLMDLEQTARRITARTRAIMPVHLYGQMAPIEGFAELARRKNLVLIEDAAQAQGSRRQGRHPATFGLAAGTSFYPGKNLGAYGDAGAVLTNSDEISRKVRALRNYGSDVKYSHPETGFNSRLDTLQAIVLQAKLEHLDRWNAARRAAARRYDALLANLPDVRVPDVMAGNDHIYHLYVVRVPRRDDLLKLLHASGIGAGVHYPTPIHLQGAFRALGHRAGDFPEAESAAKEILSLPIFPEITEEQQERVFDALQKALAQTSSSYVAV